MLNCYRVVCDTAKVRFFKQITTPALPACRARRCLRYCKSTIFQANHNRGLFQPLPLCVVCDTAKVRFFKQITTRMDIERNKLQLFAILQKYDFSSKSQQDSMLKGDDCVVCDTAKVRFFKQITTYTIVHIFLVRCLRYCKSTIFQANHN